MKRPQDRYQRAGLVLVVIGLALLPVYLPPAVGALVVAAVCFAGAVRGWSFPGQPPEPEPRLSRKARRYVEVAPEWSVDFLEPYVTRSVPDPVPFSGVEPAWTSFVTIPIRNAQRTPDVDLDGIGAELTFYLDGGKLVHDRISARWSNNPFPELRIALAPEARRLPANGVAEPLDVVARVDEQSAAYVHTADAARGGPRLRLDPARYVVRVEITGAPDDPVEPVAWYRCTVPLMSGLEAAGPAEPPPWAPRPRRRPAPPEPRAVPRKRSGSSQT